jgi:inner membrane protein
VITGMDSLSQLALGAAVSVAVLRQRQPVWRSALLGAVVGTLPDLDVLVRQPEAISEMTRHRAESHSLFYLTLLSPLLAWLWLLLPAPARPQTPRFAPWRQSLWWPTLLAIWLTLITHPLLDALTQYGTQLALPFVAKAYAVGSVFVIDPLYTLPLLIGLVLTLSRQQLRWNGLGLLLSTAYLAAGLLAQLQVKTMVQQQFAAGQLPAAAQTSAGRLLVSATPFNTLLWRIVWLETTDNDAQPLQYHEAYYSLLDSSPQLVWRSYPLSAAALAQWQHEPLVARMIWFTDGFMKLEASPQPQRWLLTDLRLGQEPMYHFRFEFTELATGQLSAPQQLERPLGQRLALSWLWQRALANTELPLADWLAQPDRKVSQQQP